MASGGYLTVVKWWMWRYKDMDEYDDIDEETRPNWLVEQWLLRNSVSTPSNSSLPSDDSLQLYGNTGVRDAKESIYEDIINVDNYKIKRQTSDGPTSYSYTAPDSADNPTYSAYSSLPVIYDGRRRREYKKSPKQASSLYGVVRRSKTPSQKRPADAYSEVLDEIRSLALHRAKSEYDELDSYTPDLEETKSNFAMVLRV